MTEINKQDCIALHIIVWKYFQLTQHNYSPGVGPFVPCRLVV